MFKNSVIIWLSGADPVFLEKSDIAEQRAYFKLGLTLFIPAILAWVGFYYSAQ